MEAASNIHIHFNENSKTALNICLALVMFGVALELKPSDFYRVFRNPKAPLVGLMSHFVVLPFITYMLILILHPPIGFALGMMLVAACPGGNIANFFAHMGKGNTALSVSLTAISELSAVFMTPFTFFFWCSLLPYAETLPKALSIDPLGMVLNVSMLIALPLAIGMLSSHLFPSAVAKISKPAKLLSVLILVSFIVFAALGNKEAFREHITKVILIVILHNGAALISGYWFGRLWRLPEADCRTITVETGIQNSGLGLVLIFNFFGGYGEMALIAATWGTWHIVSGSLLAYYWSRRPPASQPI